MTRDELKDLACLGFTGKYMRVYSYSPAKL